MPSLAKRFKLGNTQIDGAGKDFSLWMRSAANDKYFRAFFFSWIIPLVLILVYILINFWGLPKDIPLFYSRVWGEDQIIKRAFIFLPVTGTLLLGIFNFSLAVSFHEKNRVISYFLAGSSCLVSLLSMITIFNIINLIR